jgi:hypothetical protein
LVASLQQFRMSAMSRGELIKTTAQSFTLSQSMLLSFVTMLVADAVVFAFWLPRRSGESSMHVLKAWGKQWLEGITTSLLFFIPALLLEGRQNVAVENAAQAVEPQAKCFVTGQHELNMPWMVSIKLPTTTGDQSQDRKWSRVLSLLVPDWCCAQLHATVDRSKTGSNCAQITHSWQQTQLTPVS